MRLSYRGAEYDYDPTSVEMTNSGLTGQYRGQSFGVSYPRHVPVPQPVHTLLYRGAVCRTDVRGQLQAALNSRSAVEPPARSTVSGLPLALQIQRLQKDEVTEVHRQNIKRRLEQRIQAAKVRGDELLLQHLEHEFNLFA